MESCWPEEPLISMTTKRERAIKGLVQGQALATQLQFLLREPNCYGGGDENDQLQGSSSSLADELVGKILMSFTETLSLLSVPVAGEDCQNVAASQVFDSGCCDDRRSEVSGENRKTPRVAKDRRGCYKRKKTSDSWTTVSSTLEDGHAWRKYGQKEILNSKFPRSYYRCTRKHDQECKATKQVQRMENDPQIMYRTTYIGHHTCKGILKAPPIISDTDPTTWESCCNLAPVLVRGQEQDDDLQYPFTTVTNPSTPRYSNNNNAEGFIKTESKELEAPSDLTADSVSSRDDESDNLWKDLVPFGYGEGGRGPRLHLTTTYSLLSEAISRQSFHMDYVDFAASEFHLDASEFFLAS